MATLDEQAGKLLNDRLAELAAAIVERQWQQQPGLAERYAEAGRLKCERDTSYNLRYLAQSLHAHQAALFIEYVAWVKVLFARLHIPQEELAHNLRCTIEVVREEASLKNISVRQSRSLSCRNCTPTFSLRPSVDGGWLQPA